MCGIWPVYYYVGVWVIMLWDFIAAEHDRYGSTEYCGVNQAEYLVHLVCMNRLSARRVLWVVLLWLKLLLYVHVNMLSFIFISLGICNLLLGCLYLLFLKFHDVSVKKIIHMMSEAVAINSTCDIISRMNGNACSATCVVGWWLILNVVHVCVHCNGRWLEASN